MAAEKPSPSILVPPLKSQGIKTALVPRILESMPKTIRGRFVEPFMGTGVVGFSCARGRALMTDANPHLIAFYRALQNGELTSASARKHLEREGRRLAREGETRFYAIRDRFNRSGAPLDFLFLSRAAFNGMMRFNRDGGFNVPFCRKPERFAKAYVTKIVRQIEAIEARLRSGRFEFRRAEFEETLLDATGSDFVYCDPPYLGRHADYFSSWDADREDALFRRLSAFRGRFMLSTWHSNAHRKNPAIARWAARFKTIIVPHFYHVGGREVNRGGVLEALVVNY